MSTTRTSTWSHRVTTTVATLTLAGAATLTLAVQPAAAEPSHQVVIDEHLVFGAASGTFTASGGVVCPSGTTWASPVLVAGASSFLTYHLTKIFDCDDGSGAFVLRIQARAAACSPTDDGSWTVIDGWGEYDSLRGAGRLVGTYFPAGTCFADGVDDHLTGSMSNA